MVEKSQVKHPRSASQGVPRMTLMLLSISKGKVPIWKLSVSMQRGTEKAAARHETSLPLPKRMVVWMRCSRRPIARATLMSMTLCVAPVSTKMWTPVPKIAPARYIGAEPRTTDWVVLIIMSKLLVESAVSVIDADNFEEVLVLVVACKRVVAGEAES